MNDLIRSGIYTGLGAAVLAKKKFEELVEELIQNNELTRDEGRRIAQSLIRQAEDKRNELEAKLVNSIDQMLHTLKMPGRNEIEVLLGDWLERLDKFPFSIRPSSNGKNKPTIS